MKLNMTLWYSWPFLFFVWTKTGFCNRSHSPFGWNAKMKMKLWSVVRSDSWDICGYAVDLIAQEDNINWGKNFTEIIIHIRIINIIQPEMWLTIAINKYFISVSQLQLYIWFVICSKLECHGTILPIKWEESNLEI